MRQASLWKTDSKRGSWPRPPQSPNPILPQESPSAIDFDIFMPGELTPAEYYHSYLSSQRRVERWVVDTEKELKVLADHAHEQPRDHSTLSTKKAEAEGNATLALPTPASTNVAPVTERRRTREVTAHSKEQQAAHEADVRSSRRHRSVGTSSKKRSRSRPVESRSRSRPSSGSKRTKAIKAAIGGVPEIRSRSMDAHKASAHTHRRRREQQASSSLSTYLLYGALPVIYAVTGSSALLLLIAIVLCAGYLYHMETPSKTKLPA
ncbi:hypothetical protein D9619_006863 [Psilocybe cf. subviscida]|uniref:Uncharacterized protein n=1 Tax=Psilocybe cf. subviscida TaxID=2480587 RepID=A0A8H5EY15_9AGAR|nr:hypothetical protein D9619_006863 [Psilocybe cf. subviscida]